MKINANIFFKPGVNLRVATIKHGNMQNCDLRGAVLAGADLEVSEEWLGLFHNTIWYATDKIGK